jgi:hypothetical protein
VFALGLTFNSHRGLAGFFVGPAMITTGVIVIRATNRDSGR